jgi:CubicO group peptidase (beta-lactamase class C family)
MNIRGVAAAAVVAALDPAASGLAQSQGSWGWAGGYGTNVNIKPAEQMVTIIMMQTATGALARDFKVAVRQAIVD